MLEGVVEQRLKRLERYGFAVYKLRTPGKSGVMDRMILWPKYAPRPPSFLEVKRPGEVPRPLQVAVANDWKARGCDVRDYCDSVEAIDALCDQLVAELERYKI
jgi:hypothetical protein